MRLIEAFRDKFYLEIQEGEREQLGLDLLRVYATDNENKGVVYGCSMIEEGKYEGAVIVDGRERTCLYQIYPNRNLYWLYFYGDFENARDWLIQKIRSEDCIEFDNQKQIMNM